MLAVAIGVPTLFSGMFFLGDHLDLYDDAVFGAGTAFANVALMVGLVRWLGKRADQTVSDQLRAEQALSRGDERFRALVQHSSDMVSVIGPDGVRRYASPSLERALGYSVEELIGGAGLSVVHPDDLDLTRELMRKVADRPGATATGIHRLRRRDGTHRWVEAIVCNLTDNPDIGGIVITSRDITDRRRVEAALRESEAQARREEAFAQRLIDRSFDAISAIDVQGRYTAWNPAMERLTGVAKDRILGRTIAEVFPHTDGDQNLLIWKALAGEEIVELDRPYAIPSTGHSGLCTVQMTPLRDDAGNIVGALAVHHDTTERKRNEEALHQQAQLLDLAHDAVVVLDAGGKIVSWNRGAARH